MTALVAAARPYFAFARTSFLNILAYRARYFVGILTYFFNATVWYYIWRALFHEKGDGATLGGFTFPQMLTYVATGWALRSFYFNEVDREIASQVREGRLAMTLIKPVDVQAMTLAQALGESAFRLVLFTLPIGVLLGLVYPILPPASPAAFGLYLLSGVLSAFLVGAINFCVGLVAIRTTSILGVLRAKYLVLELLSGLLVPVAFFPEPVRKVLVWLPFLHMNDTPGRIWLGLATGADAARALGLQAGWTLALLLLGRLLWSATARRIEVQGGLTVGRVRFHARLLGLYFAQYAKARLAYRADFATAVLASFLGTAASFSVVLLLFSRFPHLAGWSFPEIVFLYGFSLLPYGLFNVLSTNLYEFADRYLVEGRFDRILLRPVSPLFQVLFESFRLESFQEVVTGVVAVAWAASRLPHVSPLGLALLPLWAVFGAAIYLSIFGILTASSFWIEDRVGLAPPVFNLMSFGRYPITIYDLKVKVLLSTVIPFAFASFYPTTLALRRGDFLPFFWAVPAVALLFALLNRALWRRGIAKYGSTGS